MSPVTVDCSSNKHEKKSKSLIKWRDKAVGPKLKCLLVDCVTAHGAHILKKGKGAVDRVWKEVHRSFFNDSLTQDFDRVSPETLKANLNKLNKSSVDC